MHATRTIFITAIAVAGGLLVGAAVMLTPYLFPRKPDRAAGPLEVAVHELSLPSPASVDRPPVAIRVWAPQSATIARPYPLIIYVPGWGGNRGESDVLLSDIASAGFVVAAADDISRDPPDPATDPADEVVRIGEFRAFSAQDLAQFPEVSERRTRLGYDKVARLIDALTQPTLRTMPFPIDASSIGVVGYSFGGAVAATALVRDPRVRAAVNLDGWVVDTPAASGVPRPLLALYARLDLHPSPASVSAATYHVAELARRDFGVLLALSRSSAAEVRLIGGAEHGDFTDARYAGRWKRWRPWRLTLVPPDHMRAILEAFLLPFLLRHVGGQPSRAAIVTGFPEVTPIESIADDLR